MSCDISVPVARVPEFLDRAQDALRAIMPSVEINAFGHVGDGNIHYSARKPKGLDDAGWSGQIEPLRKSLLDLVAEFGGSFSAEHGIGSDKRALLEEYAGGTRLHIMRAVKNAIDPKGLMNPGKVFL